MKNEYVKVICEKAGSCCQICDGHDKPHYPNMYCGSHCSGLPIHCHPVEEKE